MITIVRSNYKIVQFLFYIFFLPKSAISLYHSITLSYTRDNMRKKPRLSEFIKEKLEKGEIPGLIYTNKDKQIFQIPWKHGAKQNYDIQIDGIIYVEWAKATNKYKKYFDKPNVWKTNFRCAINSLQDVKCLDEEEDKVNGKLRSDKEYRTFQFITPEKKKSWYYHIFYSFYIYLQRRKD